MRLERDGDPPAHAQAAVLGGRDDLEPEASQPLEEGEVGGGAPAVEEPPPSARAAQLLAEEAEGGDAVAAGHEERLRPGRGRGERPAERAEAERLVARAPSRTGRDEPWPTAFTKRLKVSRSGSVARIENGRRSGGSAESPAFIITNWPGRASRAVSGWRKVSRK